ncbi:MULTISPECIES: arylsulfotransferase family protein [unclassified Streptosporangium]|uniref:arylsulfotransferase family protein n=1 Tax=unclassified Streptosporangium TaxID=2632669 RepID=UPI002E28A433|nr:MULTISPECIES: arylsulfotransferase family protein [unclassified Streptosporangium]
MRRSQTGEDTKDSGVFFLFSPSASYPQPFACLIDRRARIVHAWSSALEQPDPALDPPTYLRGWNHVELDGEGNLYALVPLHSLLKLRPDSTLAWRAQLPVHHDLDIGLTGVHVLTEEPRLIPWRGGTHVLLDNTVTILSRDGDFLVAHSLYDVLISHPTLRSLIDDEIGRRRASSPDLDAVARSYILNRSSGYHRGREVSRLLRDLPGSPADVLHANTVEILDAHPAGIWGHGDVLVSLRDLNLIAVLDLAARSVRWWWGPGELSGQHQPSVLPGGTVLVFDNGHGVGRSRGLEIDPSSNSIVWQYTADPPESLFCAMAGGCERLPNGNILISDAQAGRAIEVTRDGRTVWAVQIRTIRSSSAVSRTELYRISAVPAPVVTTLYGGDEAARRLAHERVRCELGDDVRLDLRSAP